MRWILIVLLMLLALAAVSGCPRGKDDATASAVSQADSDKAGEPVVGKRGEGTPREPGSTSAAGQAGSAAGAAGTLPANWPPELPEYPGSQITAGTSRVEGAETFMATMLRTSDSVEAVLKFYDEKALAAGFKKKTDTAVPAIGGSVVYENGPATFTVQAGRVTGETQTSVSLIYKLTATAPGGDFPQTK